MSEQARDVVRYIKAIENGEWYHSSYGPHELPVFGPTGVLIGYTSGLPPAFLVPTADYLRATREERLDPEANARAALAYVRRRYGSTNWSTYKGGGY